MGAKQKTPAKPARKKSKPKAAKPKGSPFTVGPARVMFDRFDPAEHSEPDREPTDDEKQAVLSGSGISTGATPGTWESSGAMAPKIVRGYGRDAGAYDRMARKDTTVAGALQRRFCTYASYDWPLVDVEGAEDVDMERSEFVREIIDSMPGGIYGLLFKILKRDQFGFSLMERVWEPEDLRWRLEDLVYMHPATINSWGFSGSGHMIGAWQRTPERGLIWLDKYHKLSAFVRGNTGRNPEGVALLRPIFWLTEAKSEITQTWMATLHLIGEGWLHAKTNFEKGSQERADLEEILEAWGTSLSRWMVTDMDTDIEAHFGGDVLPDLSGLLTPLNNGISRGFDEGLQELGTSKPGTQAVGREFSKSSDRSIAGEIKELTHRMWSEIIVPIYVRNGWDVRKSPRFVVRGLGHAEHLAAHARLLIELLRDLDLPDEDPLIEKLQQRVVELLEL